MSRRLYSSLLGVKGTLRLLSSTQSHKSKTGCTFKISKTEIKIDAIDIIVGKVGVEVKQIKSTTKLKIDK